MAATPPEPPASVLPAVQDWHPAFVGHIRSQSLDADIQGYRTVKINVCLASRGRPNALIALIVSMWRLRAGRAAIKFVVAVDVDDWDTRAAMLDLCADGIPVLSVLGERSPYLGAAYNRAVMADRADAYVVTNDRAFILTPHWDEQLRNDIAAHPGRVLWLSSPQDPDPTHPVIPADVLRDIGGKWSTEIFPFWFDDTWLAEIEYLTHGNIIKIPVQYAGERGKTKRLRDVRFWAGVFGATRTWRVEQAKALADKRGLDIAPHLEGRIRFLAGMTHSLASRAEELEDMFGDKSEPTPEYLAAKENAQNILKVCHA